MASFKQLKLFADKELDHCLQTVVRPFTEHVYFPETLVDPLGIEKHHHELQLQNLSISDTLACATCQIQFIDRTEQTIHFKSDWHRFNLKRKLRNQLPFSSEKFEDMEKDISSISGSDSSDDELSESESSLNPSADGSYNTCARNNPKIILTLADGRHLSLYRCILHGKKNFPQESQELIITAQRLPLCTYWCVVMAAGGHFAIALFERDKIIQHKTFHKYIVRAKQGSAQSAHDQKTGGKARSAGANLRRQNMLHLKQKIHELFTTWKNEIQRCLLIFVRAPSFNQQLLFGDKNAPLSASDPRIRSIPFATLRPTFSEIKRVYDQLTTMELYPEDYQFQQVEQEKVSTSQTKLSTTKKAVVESSSSDSEDSEDDLKEDDEIKKKSTKKTVKKQPNLVPTTNDRKILPVEDLSDFNELFTACRLNDIQRFDDLISRLHAIKSIDKSPSVADILNYQTAGSLDTLLHIASERGHLKIIQRLLKEGANPSLSNQRAKYPYNLCKNKETKDVFRLFRHDHPDKYDYALGQIAASISMDELERQRGVERERRRQTKKRRTDKQRSDQERQIREQEEEQQRIAFLALSEAEKRTLAVHVNFETNKRDELHLGRCWQCAKKISDEPFTYFDYKFCSTSCLKAHRTKSKMATA
ncbi:unnamed protein product [Rotaria socialis]|uniref:VLRF1 domain-containing protein n=1 Tax=Rotaria socialis TaxID=392032 RepID=A0A820T6L8_9BILA|nr:unnamed protein product [Rotaria socialis]CAF4467280.1 unnamed protein product [Rotaria socialis]